MLRKSQSTVANHNFDIVIAKISKALLGQIEGGVGGSQVESFGDLHQTAVQGAAVQQRVGHRARIVGSLPPGEAQRRVPLGIQVAQQDLLSLHRQGGGEFLVDGGGGTWVVELEGDLGIHALAGAFGDHARQPLRDLLTGLRFEHLHAAIRGGHRLVEMEIVLRRT